MMSECRDYYWNTTTAKIPTNNSNDDSNTSTNEINDITTCCPCDGNHTILFVDCEDGSDEHDNDGTCIHRPLQTIQRAQEIIKTQIRSSKSTLNNINNNYQKDYVTVYIRDGICSFNETLHLTESNVIWKAFPNENPIFSGGVLLTHTTRKPISWSQYTNNILVTDLPPNVNASAIDGLFTFYHKHHEKDNKKYHDSLMSTQIRLVRARFPNGNSEIDRMPTNYDKLGGPVSSVDAWRIAGNVSVRFPGIEKTNSSFYPWFGHSRDVRWVMDYHLENASSYYSNGQQFWQPRIATAAKYQQSNFSKQMYGVANVSSWTKTGDAVLHVIHYSWWGNWQWKVKKDLQHTNMNQQSITLPFEKGGWQDAHGGSVSYNYFFIENVLEELDQSGEWFVDKNQRKLYYWPSPNQVDDLDDWHFVANQIPEIVRIQGESVPVQNVVLDGITFAHSTTSYLNEPYVVPSAGDWSVLPKGAVTINRAVNITLDSCTWLQVNGNGVALHGMVHNSTITKGDFLRTGDSGIVSVGRLPKWKPYSGYRISSVPTNNTISFCHFGQTGVYGKQTSALFIAVSKRIRFLNNVLYDGPRAGININDGYGGGHVIERSVIFNQILESGDHGPINTWSRSAYIQESGDETGSETVIPEWNHINQNFLMMGPKFGSQYGPGLGPCSNGSPEFYCPKNGGSLFSCLDHDDGSEYYLDTRNVCAFAGMKNYIGQNKIWDSNLIVFPEGTASQNRSGTSCIWTSMDMAGNKADLPCSLNPCRTKEVYTNNTCLSYSSEPLEYDMFNETDLIIHSIHDTTIPYTARNQYYLNQSYRFYGKWNLKQAQTIGIDQGSMEASLEDISTEELSCLARGMLDLDVLDNYCKDHLTPWTRDTSASMISLSSNRSL